jgi:hypothetical protein
MYAITIKPHWAWAILHAGKRVENRDFLPPALVGQRVALHAGRPLGGATAEARALRALAAFLARAGYPAAAVWLKGQRPTLWWTSESAREDGPSLVEAARIAAMAASEKKAGEVFSATPVTADHFLTSCVVATADVLPYSTRIQGHEEIWRHWHRQGAWLIPGCKAPWALCNVKFLAEPVPCAGQQGVWQWRGDA